jgi:hypothetical protein
LSCLLSCLDAGDAPAPGAREARGIVAARDARRESRAARERGGLQELVEASELVVHVRGARAAPRGCGA